MQSAKAVFAIALAMATSSVFAGDLSGKWTGNLVHNSSSGEQRDSPAFVIFKEEGKTVTGSGGPSESEQHPFTKVTVDGDLLAFEVHTDQGPMKFNVKVAGDTIEGSCIQERSDGETRTGKLTLKRQR